MKRLRGMLPCALLAACGGWLLPPPTHAGSAGPCVKSADAILKSCRFGATDEFWLAVARCKNTSTPADVRACRADAKDEQRDGNDECAAQHDARLEVCADLGGGAYEPVIDPMHFVGQVDNQYFPLVPGTTLVYEGMTPEGMEHDEVSVLNDTREILGVTCVVVRDVAQLEGEVIEDTLDFYAQDDAGNVWYFGEESRQFEGGALVAIDGSWQAGRDGALPGIIMQAAPAVDTPPYRQEYAPEEAEDLARVVSLNEAVMVPKGSYVDVLETNDFSPLEPGIVEQKFYAQGVGIVLEIDADGSRLELVP
jgi:hypothetical protein